MERNRIIGLVSISYPHRYDSFMAPVKTSKTVGNIKSDTIEEWVVPMEQKEKGAAPVKKVNLNWKEDTQKHIK